MAVDVVTHLSKSGRDCLVLNKPVGRKEGREGVRAGGRLRLGLPPGRPEHWPLRNLGEAQKCTEPKITVLESLHS